MSHKEREEKIAKFWEQHNCFEKSVEQRAKTKQFVFYDGPPFATGTPHYGHILGLTSKDLFPRYKTMQGFRVERRWGWDCHGLPIENMMEKELGIKTKKGIEEFGVDNFNEACRAKVLFFADEWKKTLRRMGKWIDFDNSYKTMDNSYMETVWWIFKTLYDKDLVYEGKKILLYCPRCETPIANAEIAMDNSYKNVTEKSVVAKFKLKEENTFLLAWTTTPWTLPGNVALFVNPEFTYVKVKQGNEFLLLAKDCLSVLVGKYDVVEELSAETLVGKQYEPLYDLFKGDKFYTVYKAEFVTSEQGTGIVHTATLYGEDDFREGQKTGLTPEHTVGLNGCMLPNAKLVAGLFFKKADKVILEDLENRNLSYKQEMTTHSYPHCYRCDTPLLYYAINSWFINIQKVKENILKRNEDINWSPKHLKHGRFKQIVETAPDWSISRNRFWATSMPVWKSEDGQVVRVVGSVEELRKLSTTKFLDDVDLHKHVTDLIELKDPETGKILRRIPEVFDCWVESGSMPYGELHYPFENKEEFELRFPGDFISEYVGQVRTWFYYMHAMGVLLFDKAPFKDVVVTGNILSEDGSKMSKSKKNYPDPVHMFDTYGADALRFYLMSSPVMRANDLNFSENGVKEVYRKVITLLTNVKRFYDLFSEENKEFDSYGKKDVLDKWVVSKTNNLVKSVTAALDEYDTITACTMLTGFIDELSTWYVRRSRDRFKGDDKDDAVKTLAYVLRRLSLIMAPLTPFVAEEMHQSFKEKNDKLALSVHLEDWPKADLKLIDEQLEADMILTREVVNKALEQRDIAKIPVRQALGTLEVSGVELSADFLELVKDEVNVKEVKLLKGKELAVKLDTTITPELLQEGMVRDFMRKVNDYRKELKLQVADRIELYYETTNTDLTIALKKFEKDVKEGTQSTVFKFKIPDGLTLKDLKVHDVDVRVAVRK
ncbi:isoleucine--tRNA ligase [Candidatus Woesearchaeota archaeon CG10_big_fil_rev_8_21_14_0_10_37_12]|nr:MAG: isoleucine--tRNA ligase [Candidatus Woesearchaeota archaeon CG10_big_fil_rev_8_21_14_0_10_37_12]